MWRPVSRMSAAIGVRNLSDQTHCGTAEREEPPLGFGDAELGALAGDADVGALQDFGSAGDGCALDGCDQRLGEAVDP